MSNREQSSKQTRIALVAAAGELFHERGYAAVGTEEIVARAGVSRGALYHHFEGKAALFEAVFEQADTEFVALVHDAMADVTDPVEALQLGFRIFLDCCLDANLVRLALLDAPNVLGWARWREIQLRHGLGLVRVKLTAGMETGQLRVQPVLPLCHLLFGTLMELGMFLANSPDPAAARVEVGNVLSDLVDSLLVPGPTVP